MMNALKSFSIVTSARRTDGPIVAKSDCGRGALSPRAARGLLGLHDADALADAAAGRARARARAARPRARPRPPRSRSSASRRGPTASSPTGRRSSTTSGASTPPPTACAVEEVGPHDRGPPLPGGHVITSEANMARLEEIRARQPAPGRSARPRAGGGASASSRAARRSWPSTTASIPTRWRPPRPRWRRPTRWPPATTPEIREILDRHGGGDDPVAQPGRHADGDGVVPRARWARPARARRPAVPVPEVHRPRQQPRLVHVHAARRAGSPCRALYDRWRPQIVHDIHQMGARAARLFVPPYVDPWEPNVDPALTRRRQRAGHARGGAAHLAKGTDGRGDPRHLRRLEPVARLSRTPTAACAS